MIASSATEASLRQSEVAQSGSLFMEQRGAEPPFSGSSKEDFGSSTSSRTVNLVEFAASIVSQTDMAPRESILARSEQEASNLNSYERSYTHLREWISSSLVSFQAELAQILLPVFVHFFLDLIRNDHDKKAKELFQKYRNTFDKNCTKDVDMLSGISNRQQLSENEFAKRFTSRKYIIRMSRYSFNLLMDFVLSNNYMLLFRIINSNIDIRVMRESPGVDVEDTSSLFLRFSREDQSYRRDVSDVPVYLDCDENSGLPQTGTDIDGAGRSGRSRGRGTGRGRGGRGRSSEPSRACVPLPPFPSTELALRRHDSLLRLPLSPARLPSVCMFTLFGCEGLIQTFFSRDATILACTSEDSIIRLWELQSRADRERAALGALIENRSGTERDMEVDEVEGAPKLTQKSKEVESQSVNRTSSRSLVGHSGPVYSCDFSPDCRYLLSCSQDGSVRLWHVESGECICAYYGHVGSVWSVAFSPVGYYFVTGCHDRIARLYSTERLYPLRYFAGHLSDVDVVAFHPNSNYVFSGSSDRTTRMWDVQTGDCVRLFLGHDSTILALSVSPDGKLLFSGGGNGELFGWDLQTGAQLMNLSGRHRESIYSLDISLDGTILASASSDNSILIWNVQAIRAKSTSLAESLEDEEKTSDGNVASSKVGELSSNSSSSASAGKKVERVLLKSLKTKNSPVRSVRFSYTNVLLASGEFASLSESL